MSEIFYSDKIKITDFFIQIKGKCLGLFGSD